MLVPPTTSLPPAGAAMPGYPQQNYPPPNYPPPATATPSYAPPSRQASLPAEGTYRAEGTNHAAPEELVVEVRVEGNRTVPTHKIMSQIHTRSGRAYGEQTVQDDVRALTRMGLFVDVRPFIQRVQGGVIVVFRVAERPLIQDVIIIGNDTYKTGTLKKEAEVKSGDAADPFAVENGRQKIEKFYRDHGYSKVRVTVLEGNKAGDLRVIYMVDEGPQQKVFWVNFVGNSFVSSQRLKTIIETHPPYFYLFSGEYDSKKLDEDVNKLTAYYRGFGYFYARVGRTLEVGEDQKWVTVTFAIDEGPRYKIGTISFLGNRKFDNPRLAAKLKLLSGQYFDQNQQNLDLMQLRDEYGGDGYVFAKIEPENRMYEKPGMLDIVYHVEEGDRYRIGPITIEIKGENPHTKITTVLTRLSVKPGDIADTREIRNSERRLKAAQLFKVEPMKGIEPKIVYSPPDSDGSMVANNRRTTYYRYGGDGLLPPLPPGERYLELDFSGEAPERSEPPAMQAAPCSQPSDPPPTYQGQRYEQTTYRTDPTDPTDQAVAQGPATYQNSAPAAQAYPQLAGPQPLSQPVPYEVRYQPYDGWQAQPQSQPQPQPQGQSWGNDNGGNNSYSAEQRSNGNGQPQPYYATAPQQPAAPVVYYQPPPAVTASGDAYNPAYASNPPAYSAAPPPASGYSGYGAPNAASPAYVDPAAPPPASGYSGYGAPNAASPAYVDPSAPPPASGYPASTTSGNGALYTAGGPLAPAGDRPIAQVANANGLFGDPVPAMVPTPSGDPLRDLPLQISPEETQTGRLMFGVGVNSDAGLVGNITVDEQNFDWRNVPTSWQDVWEGRAFRGAGERFRLELVPGTQVQRYMVTFQEPYLNDQPIDFGMSGFYYQRIFTEWTEQRVGGSLSLGYRFTHDLTGSVRFQGQNVKIENPEYPVPSLLDVLGHNELYTFSASLQHDTRDNPFNATEGHLLSASMDETIGSFQYPRASVEYSQFYRIFQRADRSGNHVLNLQVRAGYSGDNTPIFERFYAGGFSSLRGFAFRGVTPRDPVYGMGVGGDFQLLATAQYLFPITADDMLKGVVFVDAGTVEPTITQWTQTTRVAPGFGLRISIPMMGPAPIALDFAFPINKEPGDVTQIFSFFVGFNH